MRNLVSLQTDTCSCGIRVMTAAEMLSHGLVPKFSNNNLSEIRQLFTMILLDGYLDVDQMRTSRNDLKDRPTVRHTTRSFHVISLFKGIRVNGMEESLLTYFVHVSIQTVFACVVDERKA